ncbi:NADP-dependent oxidoreductase [Cellvibrio mixtus]|uniref:NADP-dependent oxidoreductase n=1 Tax=Cellvibrio mixtus TaxID=39650 RepID=UPI000586EA1F|nr:NADP-dependent oxidoreductase [Cellvibrio mixtus]
MKAVVINEYGNNDVIHLVDAIIPQPGAREVLVKVKTAGVNPVDWRIRSGAGTRFGLTLPIALGSEIAGTIEKLGDEVTRFTIGDAVYGKIRTGGFAEYAIAREDEVAHKPQRLDFIHAAAIPLAALTAWQAMFDLAKLTSGQRILITGASGGVGSLAVQLAKAKGAYVIGTASGHNGNFVKQLGVDEFVDYTRQDFATVVHNVDVVFDTVGGETYQHAFKTLKTGGYFVTAVEFPTEEQRNTYGDRLARVFCKSDPEDLAAISALVDNNQLIPHIATVLPLSEIKQALDLSETRRTRGKIVLQIAVDNR